MAYFFNKKHIPIQDTDLVYLKLAKGTNPGYRLPHMSVLDVRKIGPFKVKRKVGKVAFELELPPHINIHPVISCIHLEPARKEHLKDATPPPPIIVDGEERYLINRIVRKERRRQKGDRTRKVYYRVRWQGYGPEEDTWIESAELKSQVPEMVEAFEANHR